MSNIDAIVAIAKKLENLNEKYSQLSWTQYTTGGFFSHRNPRFIKTTLRISKFLSFPGGFQSEYQIINEMCRMANIIAPNKKKEIESLQLLILLSIRHMKN